MSISTPLTALLGITHPILSAPMDVIAGARLTAAVSAAGGFGILGGGYGDQAWLERETAKLKGASAPFGIGFITWSLAKQPELLDIALAARPRSVMLSFGDPKPFVARSQYRLSRQRGHPLGIGEQAAARAGQRHAAAVPLEQSGADLGFQCFHPLRDVGLHGVEFVGGAGDAAQTGDRRKGLEIAQFHGEFRFIFEMEAFFSIHF